MNDAPNDTHPFDEPMDTSLLQLERELFSLSPAAPPRSLVTHLDSQMLGAVPAARTIAPSNVVPFRWSRIVVPAAAAVVVVSVLNRLEGPTTGHPAMVSQPGQRASGLPGTAPMEQATGYMLKSEPVYVIPSGWEAVEHQYWIQPSGPPPAYNVPSRQSSGTVPVSFH